MIRAERTRDPAPADGGSAPRGGVPTATTMAGAGVPASLHRARGMIEPALRRRVGSLTPEIRRVAAYHLGFEDQDGRPANGGGKAVRPALAMLSAEAVGAPAETALPGAVAVELVHNFSLLHDDVMDHDDERRHRPTAWALFGIGPAIVAGDAMLALAHRQLIEVPGGVPAARALAEATGRMIAGQAQDLAFASRLDVSVRECVEMSANKTGALLSCASALGAILAGAPPGVVRSLEGFGMQLGLAFQAVDDLLGIWGRPQVTGKPIANDLREHKKSLPVVAALASRTGAGRRLADILSNGRLPEDAVRLAAVLVEEAGGRELAGREADRRIERALGLLDTCPLEPSARAELAQIASFVARREF